jgi:hypothetical protein
VRNEELTDFFAGLALMAMIQRNTGSQKLWPKQAYQVADDMMEERKRRDFEERTSC